jgi:uncharacterized protein (TIRG00374 family)
MAYGAYPQGLSSSLPIPWDYSEILWYPGLSALNKTGYLISVVLKLLVSAGLLYWLLKDAEFKAILEHIHQANPLLLLLAFSMYFLGYFITAARWKTLLRAQGYDASLNHLVRSFMVGLFFSNFLPSTIGGDIVRMYDSWKIMKKKSEAFAVIFMDRFFGITALFCFATLAMLFIEEVEKQVPALRPVLFTGLLAAVAMVFLLFSRADYLRGKSESWRDSHPNPLVNMAGKLLGAFSVYGGKTGALLQAFSLSLLLQFNVILHFILIVLAMNMDVPIIAMFVIIPVATVIMMLPVSINGIGLREAVFVMFFGLFGIASDQSIAFAWIAYGFVLVQGLLGGLVFAMRLIQRKPVKKELENVED